MNHEETDKRFDNKFPVEIRAMPDTTREIKDFIHSERELAYKEGQESVLNCDCKEKSDGKEGYFCNLCDPEAVKKMEKAALIKKLEERRRTVTENPLAKENADYSRAVNEGLSDAIKIIEGNL